LTFNDFDLDPKLLKAIQITGFSTPTAIQKAAIPEILKGEDILASAQTGTGKTAAFVVPGLQLLLNKDAENKQPNRVGRPRILILTPTRELAMQVGSDIITFGRFTHLKFATVMGGVSFAAQARTLRSSVDILVATPGRLLDHMTNRTVDLSGIELFVLDEADRMLDMGFIKDVERISQSMSTTKQTLMFSATFESAILKISQKLLKTPKKIQLTESNVRHESIEQSLHCADNHHHKQKLLAHILSDTKLSQVVIFTATKRGADELASSLKIKGHQCGSLHGDMNQAARKRTIEAMKRGRYRVLVATDVAARGLDIKGLSHVVNFDLPMIAEDYIHRIGRTGRGGDTGTAVSLVGPQDWQKLVKIERLTGQKLARQVVAGLEPQQPEPSAARSMNPKRNFHQQKQKIQQAKNGHGRSVAKSGGRDNMSSESKRISETGSFSKSGKRVYRREMNA